MAFRWRADNGWTLNTGLVNLWFFRGSGPELQRNPIFLIFPGSAHDVMQQENSYMSTYGPPFSHSCITTIRYLTKLFSSKLTSTLCIPTFMCGSRGGGGGDRGSGPPWKSQKNIGFLAILVQIPWKITKLPSQHSTLSHHQHASETPFKWRFAGGPMMARL